MKTLIDKIKKAGKKIGRGACLVAAVASIGIAGCKLPEPVPINYAPEFTSTPVTQVNENSPYNYPAIAKDLNGDSISYSLSVAPSWLSIDSSTGVISGTTPEVTSDSSFSVEVGVSDGINPVVTQAYTLIVKDVPQPPPVIDYLDVEGWLQGLDTKSPKGGVVKIFNSADLKTPIETVSADPITGYFSVHSTTKKISDLSGVVIESAIKEDGIWKGYVETENFPVGDIIMSKPIMVKLFPNYSTPGEFKTFMNQINMSAYGLTRFDLENAEGIEILLKNCDPDKNWNSSGDPNIGWQYLNDPQNLKTKSLNKGIANYVGGEIIGDNLCVYINGKPKIIPIIIEASPNSQDYYTIENNVILPKVGWVTITPNKNIGGGQTNFFWDFDNSKTLIKRARIDLGVVNDVVPIHEYSHVFIAANPDYDGHCNIPPFYYASPSGANTLTITTPNNISLTHPGVADTDAGKIEYNYFYQLGKGLNDTLGQSFSDGEFVY